jgi:hypothetical protein
MHDNGRCIHMVSVIPARFCSASDEKRGSENSSCLRCLGSEATATPVNVCSE